MPSNGGFCARILETGSVENRKGKFFWAREGPAAQQVAKRGAP